MSGFDGNPFADPEGANPFADPSVTEHTSSAQRGLEEYNPFADDHAPATVVPEPASAPIVRQPDPPSIQPTTLPPAKPTQSSMMEPSPPPYPEQFPGEDEPIIPPSQPEPAQQPTPAQAAPVQTGSALTPEQELELSRREPNFPPCLKLKGCPIKPCFYHNISLDIQPDRRKFVRLLYFFWQYICFTLFFNFIACATIFGVNNSSSNGVNFGFSILWFVAFVPCSFWCWYWCSYKAFRSDSSLRFMFFFFIFFCQFVTCCLFAIGIPEVGSSGMIIVLSIQKYGRGGFILGMIVFVMWAAGAVINFILLVQITRFYRTSGYSIEKAQMEAGSAVANNEGVRQAVVAGVKGSL